MTKTTTYEAKNKRFHVQLEEYKNLETGTTTSDVTVFDREDGQHLILSISLRDFEDVGALLADIITQKEGESKNEAI